MTAAELTRAMSREDRSALDYYRQQLGKPLVNAIVARIAGKHEYSDRAKAALFSELLRVKEQAENLPHKERLSRRRERILSREDCADADTVEYFEAEQRKGERSGGSRKGRVRKDKRKKSQPGSFGRYYGE